MNSLKLGKSRRLLPVVGGLLCLWAGGSLAQTSEPEGNGIRLSGFGTLGAVHADAPAGWGLLRTIDQPGSSQALRTDVDSRLGIQLNYAPNSQFEWVGQLLAARRLPGAAASDAIEWAFAAYRPNADVTLRAGRLNLDQFVMSDFRNVGFAYLYARPPIEYYGSIPTTLDGADITRIWNLADSRWRAKGFIGNSKIGGFDLSQAFGITVSREAEGLLIRAGLSHAKFASTTPGLALLLNGLDQVRALPVPAVSSEADDLYAALNLSGTSISYATLGLTYEQQQWQYAVEVMQLSNGPSSKIHSGYVGIGRRFGSVTLYGVLSGANDRGAVFAAPAWDAALTPIVGPAAAQQAQMLGSMAAVAASASTRQSTVSLGTRWDILPQLDLKVQWDHVRVSANGGSLWSNATGDPGSANIATVLVDFIF